MLILSRQQSEAVIITLPDGRQVRVTVQRLTHSNRVKLGFEAPGDIGVYREELLEREEEGGRVGT